MYDPVFNPRTEKIVGLRDSGWTFERIGEVIDPPITRERVRQIFNAFQREEARLKREIFLWPEPNPVPAPVFVDDRVLLTDGEMELDRWVDFDGEVRLGG